MFKTGEVPDGGIEETKLPKETDRTKEILRLMGAIVTPATEFTSSAKPRFV